MTEQSTTPAATGARHEPGACGNPDEHPRHTWSEPKLWCSGLGTPPAGCVFCLILAGGLPSRVVRRWVDAIAIVPLRPLTEGHLLVIPNTHTRDAAADPYITGYAMLRAAELAAELQLAAFNIVCAAGPEAGQEIFHLHLHLLPRVEGDGLSLWDAGRARPRAVAADGR